MREKTKIDNDIKLGDRIDVMIGERQCVSEVSDITKDGTLIIAAPTYHSVKIPVPNGDLVQIIYYRPVGMLAFVALVKRRLKEGEIDLLELEIKSPVSRHQRRDYVRFDTVFPLMVRRLTSEDMKPSANEELKRKNADKRQAGIPRPVTKETVLEKCMSLDISGGGMRFKAKKSYPVNANIECTLKFKEDSEMFSVDAVVVRSDPDTVEEPNVSVRFVNIDESIRRKIISYVFEEQIKMRKLTAN